jgi:hypothetical protein
MRSPSSEDKERFTTGAFPEDPPCSHTGERGWHEETSGGDVSGGGGVLATSDDGLLSLVGERVCLVPLLSSIIG